MYTVDDEREDLEQEEIYNNRWDNIKGLIFKIIIIILCIIVLIWLIKALKTNKEVVDNSEVHAANIEKVRLAAEEYFFIKNNKDKVNSISLAGLKNEGLIDDVIDANNKVCNDYGTNVTLLNDTDAYKMTIRLSCSTNDNDEIFYYRNNTLACLNCTGKTKMTGKSTNDSDKKEENGGSKNDDDNVPDDNSEYKYYSCVDWSDWSKDRVQNEDLTERSKTLVLGVKYGTKTIYSDWSDYTTNEITSSDTIEVETKTETQNVWSETKTGTNIDTNNPNIKIVSSKVVNEKDNSCTNGYIENNICYSNKETVGNLTYKEYNSGKYKILNGRCEGVKTIKDSDGSYVLTYLNCRYNKKISNTSNTKSYTLYTYQELETRNITYYRYRTISTVNEPDQYTDKKYEEQELPEGYVKVDGSEEIYYSYKLTYCEK